MFSSRAFQNSARPVLPARSHPPTRHPARSVRLRLAIGGPAVALMAVAGGMAGSWSAGSAAPASALSSSAFSAAASAGGPASAGPATELDALTQTAAAPAARRGPRQIARAMLARFHWSAARQFPSLDKLWNRESGWRVHAYNRRSGAQGIPQADPGRKMASAGPHWSTSAVTQIRWGLRYIRSRYGSPRRAWQHEVSAGWY